MIVWLNYEILFKTVLYLFLLSCLFIYNNLKEKKGKKEGKKKIIKSQNSRNPRLPIIIKKI